MFNFLITLTGIAMLANDDLSVTQSSIGTSLIGVGLLRSINELFPQGG